ncbi:Hpt domain-containing protein [Thiocapsa imhoffii]|uniref:Hpt domain-containing protein n=1 Tax=Thiocapsa imhoffii TaxID=382777 RepID=UPI0019054829
MTATPANPAGQSAAPADDESRPLPAPDPGEVLDLAVLIRLEADLGRESVRELLTLFGSEAARRCTRLEAAIAAGDPLEAAKEAHALKGSALTFGACRLSACALSFEQAGRGGDLNFIVQSMPQLLGLLQETQRQLGAHFGA